MILVWNWIVFNIIIGIGFIIYFYTKKKTEYFTRKGIKFIPFSFPIIGNNCKVLMQKEHLVHLLARLYNEFPDQNYVGLMLMNDPLIVIKDLDTIKQVTIKDFDHFVDHHATIDEDQDPLFGKNLMSLKGDKWRDMRATLSPAFTSSKMRNMFQFIEEIARQMAEFYLNELQSLENKEKGLEIEMKDAFTRYTNDVIATSAFGIKVNSFTERENEFYKKGSIVTDFSGIKVLKFFISITFPTFARVNIFDLRPVHKFMRILKNFFHNLTGIKLTNDHVSNFFRNLILDAMKTREEKNIIRNDMIQLLMDAKKGSLKHDEKLHETDVGFATVLESNIGKQTIKREWSDDDLVAQAIIFFIAGFETGSTLLSFMSHELTINPDIQRKLQEEIDEIINEKGSTLDYDDLSKMKYLDMVVTETLRMWPPSVITDRRCVKKYTLPPISNTSTHKLTLEPGESICIPIHSIHHDPKYYENPEKFDPERFSDDNKHNINPLAFLPFGIGPRNCIGSRFALMEIKTVLFHLLAKFDFVETAKTDNPIKLSRSALNLKSVNGFWIGLKPRHI